MTREDICNEYNVANGIIRSPGRFEGEPVYAPYFWDFSLDGGADRYDDDGVMLFIVTPEDRAEFPELRDTKSVRIWASDQGFIHVY